jgi:hypothetical protein
MKEAIEGQDRDSAEANGHSGVVGYLLGVNLIY